MGTGSTDVKMSETVAKAAADVSYCASCGCCNNEGDDTEFKPCPYCDLVRYCSDKCRKDHRTEHELSCKERASELRDKLLFKQPESSHLGDCPVCFLPHPLEDIGFPCHCCGKRVCAGCYYQMFQNKNFNCPFCRTTPKELKLYCYKERAALNDPTALLMTALLLNAEKHASGEDFDKEAFDYCSRAAAFGDAEAHELLSKVYESGIEGVEKDDAMSMFHLEEAAIAGHGKARYELGKYEYEEREKFVRGVSHFMIGSKLGDNDSIKALQICYKNGHVSKDDFATALRAHQAAVDATKSPQREAAKEFFRRKRKEA